MAKRLDARPLLVLAIALAGCVNFSPLDDLDTTTPPTDAFNLALYRNYTFLAKSFGQMGQAQYNTFDREASMPLATIDQSLADLANTYASKALKLTRDEMVEPEPSRDIQTYTQRDRLVRSLAVARDAYPRDAARAQADWDCWHLNLRVQSQAAAAENCHQSFEVTLPRLETEAAAVTAERARVEAERQRAAQAAQQGAQGSGDTEALTPP
jgi:hypothetical protein